MGRRADAAPPRSRGDRGLLNLGSAFFTFSLLVTCNLQYAIESDKKVRVWGQSPAPSARRIGFV